MLTRLEKKQKSCGNSVLGDTQNLIVQGPEQPALKVSALSSRLEQRYPEDPSHPHFSVTLWFCCPLRTTEQLGLEDTSGELWSMPWHLQGWRSHMVGFQGWYSEESPGKQRWLQL